MEVDDGPHSVFTDPSHDLDEGRVHGTVSVGVLISNQNGQSRVISCFDLRMALRNWISRLVSRTSWVNQKWT